MPTGEALELLRALLLFVAGSEPDAARLRDVACLATNVWFEARGSPFVDKLAVAQVVVNRVRDPAHPDTVCGVVHEPFQFSWTVDDRPDEVRIRNRAERDAWLDSIVAALTALDGRTPDLAPGATHFHAVGVSPEWAEAFEAIARWGGHRYYRPPPAASPGRTRQGPKRTEPAAQRQTAARAPLQALPRPVAGAHGLDGFWARAGPRGLGESSATPQAVGPFAWLRPAAGAGSASGSARPAGHTPFPKRKPAR